MDKQVAVFMKAYRNEPKIHDAAESVLNQSYRNIKLYILVNENTKAELRKYEETDDRVILMDGDKDDGFRYLAKKIAEDGNDYVMTIDADDCYYESAVEQLLCFAENNNLDIAAGGIDFVTEAGKTLETRGYAESEIWEINQTSQKLSQMYCLFRAIWGKIYSARLIQRLNLERLPKPNEYGGYGGDTLFVFNAMYDACRMGVLNKTVYRYLVSSAGGSHSFEEGRLKSDSLLFSFVKRFLEEKSVYSEENSKFLFTVYGNAVWDTLRLVMDIKLSSKERLNACITIFENPLTKIFMIRNDAGLLKQYTTIDFGKAYMGELFGKSTLLFENNSISDVFHLYEIITETKEQRLNEKEFSFLADYEGGIPLFHYSNRKDFSRMLCRTLSKLSEKNAVTALEILRKVIHNPLLVTFFDTPVFAVKCHEIMEKVLLEKNREAMEQAQTMVLTLSETRFQGELLEVWSNLAAFLEDAGEYIFAKEVQIEYLVQNGNKEKAGMVLNELEQLNVEDENILYLRTLL
mgnify:CR=1 FL=1